MKKIIARFVCGFGNQCFLYAAGRELSLKYGAELVLLDMYSPKDLRQFALCDFNCQYKRKVRNGRIARRIAAWLHAKRLAEAKTARSCHSGSHYFDFSNVELHLPEQLDGNIHLDWYFQSEKFFNEFADQIATDFTLKDDSWLERDAMASRIRETQNAIFCHVRSYNDAAPDGTMTLPVSFYKNAAAIMCLKLGGNISFQRQP